MTIPAELVAALAGQCRVDREVGAGGMATVYLAHDIRHDRLVALKVLRPELATVIGAERFLAEIKTTAKLQHPHILPLLDSGAVSGTAFYTMPYVTGESLRQRLDREKQLAIPDAVRIATEVADGLDYAHRAGVIHRDIKPENILLQDRRAVIADFGIALAVSRSEGATRMTETGMSLGTPQYMSPEQAMGERNIDARADIYALGCMLHEMLVGEPPFTGASAQIIVAKSMTVEAESVTTSRKTVPPNVAAAILVALSKLPADRFASAADFAAALANPAFSARGAAVAGGAGGRVAGRRAVWFAAGAVVAAAIGASAAWVLRPSRPEAATERWDVVAPDSVSIDDPSVSAPAISPDGTLLTFVARRDTTRMLYVSELGVGRTRAWPETRGARAPFFSADGKWIGFFAADQIRKLELASGRVTVVRDGISQAILATWTDGDKIAFEDAVGYAWVDANGGTIHRLTLRPNDIAIASLPNDRIIAVDHDERDCVVSLKDGSIEYLTRDGAARSTPAPLDSSLDGVWPRFVAPDFLVYWRPGTILSVVRFDPKSLRVGKPIEVQRGVRAAVAGVSPGGAWAYSPPAASGAGELAELGPSGIVRRLPLPPRRLGMFTLSPDGRRVAFRLMTESGRVEAAVYDLGAHATQPTDRIEAGSGNRPFWGRSGRYLYADSASGVVYRRDLASGALDSIVIQKKPEETFELAAVVNDTLIVNLGSLNGGDVLLVPFSEPAKRLPFIAGVVADVSLDEQWIAYRSKNGKVWDLFVAPLRSPNRALRIENAVSPVRWGSDSQLFFVRGDSIVRSRVSLAPSGPSMTPTTFVASAALLNSELPSYVPLAGGHSVMAVVPSTPPDIHYLTVIRHWGRELERVVRAGERGNVAR